MNRKGYIRILGQLSVLGAIGLLLWWFAMPLFLPVAQAAAHFELLILDPHWVPVNLVGLIATLLLALGFPGIFLRYQEHFRMLGFAGLLIAEAGLILFTSIQYYETVLWPVTAETNPELLRAEGALVFGDPVVFLGLVISGALLGIGYLLFGIEAARTKCYPKAPLWLLVIGAVVFGNGVVFPIRTVGLISFCVGTIWLSGFVRRGSA